MKCSKCGFENKDKAKFCTKCGNSLNSPVEDSTQSDNSKYVIIALIVVIIILAGTIGYFAVGSLNNNPVQVSDNSHNTSDSSDNPVDDSSSSAAEDSDAKTSVVSSSKSSKSSSKEWVSIGKYSGSGSGSKTITVPEGEIMIKLSAYPIKNYSKNHLYVSGSNGESGGVDWGSSSAVKTKSDSFTYTSSSEELFTIDYYETVNWEVEFFRYQ